tara:strand:- start:24 stop:1103 length:1080 start_codon:yes stop_codon:yes gene_type:complete
MIDFWGQNDLAEKINQELKNKEVPHTQLISDKYGGGGVFLAISIAKELLGRDPFLHPDFFICFPVIKVDKKTEVSLDLLEEFKSFYEENNYCSVNDWLLSLGSSNKQGSISVEEVSQLQQRISLKAYEGKNKVCVLWAPELLNISAANKMLKLLEEPPSQTYFILISEKPDLLLPTIYSRSILLSINKLSASKIEEKLIENNVEGASEIANACDGSWRTALELSDNSTLRKKLESIWVMGLRSAFRSIGNKSIVVDLMSWADDVSGLTRDEQKSFLELGSTIIRSALIVNYNANEASHYISLNEFNIKKLAPFINSENIIDITDLMDETYYYVKRNANSKILFSSFILKIARYLNSKEA